MKKEDFEFYLLIPTFYAPRIQDNEFILILNKGDIRKPVILTYPGHKFERKLKYFKKLNWN